MEQKSLFTKFSEYSLDTKIVYVALLCHGWIWWIIYFVYGWDGLWKFEVSEWFVFPRFYEDYEVLVRYYNNDVAFKYFQYTFHNIIISASTPAIMILLRLTAFSRYPYKYVPKDPEGTKGTKISRVKILLMFVLGWVVILQMTFFDSMIKLPSEHSLAKYRPLSFKHYYVTMVFSMGYVCISYASFLFLRNFRRLR